jgi:hypothetical protein
MNHSKKLIAGAFALVLALTQAGATGATTYSTTGTKVAELSQSDWKTIEEEAEFEGSLSIEEMPMLKTVNIKSLEMDFLPTRSIQVNLSAPFANDDVVGLVILDDGGDIVHSASGTYEELKQLRLRDYYSVDMTYVVRMYSEANVFATKLQVEY